MKGGRIISYLGGKALLGNQKNIITVKPTSKTVATTKSPRQLKLLNWNHSDNCRFNDEAIKTSEHFLTECYALILKSIRQISTISWIESIDIDYQNSSLSEIIMQANISRTMLFFYFLKTNMATSSSSTCVPMIHSRIMIHTQLLPISKSTDQKII